MMEEATKGLPLPFLAAWRLKKRMSQQMLAERSVVSKSAIQYLETGRRVAHFGTINKLAEALGITVDELIETNPLPVTEPSNK